MNARGAGSLRREGAWAMVDQMLSSGTNFAPPLILARVLGPAAFGTFSLTFLAWFLCLSVVRSAVIQPYTLAASALDREDWRVITSRAAGLIVMVGTVIGIAFGAAAAVVGLGSSLGRPLVTFVLLAPGLALQEFWRAASFAGGRARTAAANDALWAVVQTVVFVAIVATGRVTPANSLLAWGAGAWVAALAGMGQLSVRPSLSSSSLRWGRQVVRVGAWFTGATTVSSVGAFGVAAIVAGATGQQGLGLFRMVQGNLFGPVQLLIVGAESVFLPHLVRSMRRMTTSGRVEAAQYSLMSVGAVAAYGLPIVFFARPLLVKVFGSAYAPAAAIVAPMLVVYLLDAISDGAAILLRARARGASLLSAQTVGTLTRLLAVTLLAGAYGVKGAVWGLAVGSAAAAACMWLVTFSNGADQRAAVEPYAPIRRPPAPAEPQPTTPDGLGRMTIGRS